MTPAATHNDEILRPSRCGNPAATAAAATAPTTIATPAATGVQCCNSAAAIKSAATPGANVRHCATPATRAVHSHSTTAAAIAQTAAKIQPPSKAMATASGAKTEADAVRRRKFSVSGAAGFASL